MRSVGAYEAKTHLPRLLDEVAKGNTITITKHGVAVAQLVPPAGAQRPDPAQTIAALRRFRRGVTLGGVTVKEMVQEGRR